MLKIYLKRTSPTHHEFKYIRGDNSGESHEIETKTFLGHDLTHLALEKSGNIKNGFYGLIESGLSYKQLTGLGNPELPNSKIIQVEWIVGPLSSYLKNRTDIDIFYERLHGIFISYNEKPPSWLTKEVIIESVSLYDAMIGEWKSLGFGNVLELTFPE